VTSLREQARDAASVVPVGARGGIVIGANQHGIDARIGQRFGARRQWEVSGWAGRTWNGETRVGGQVSGSW
jgi:hypothetical protein